MGDYRFTRRDFLRTAGAFTAMTALGEILGQRSIVVYFAVEGDQTVWSSLASG